MKFSVIVSLYQTTEEVGILIMYLKYQSFFVSPTHFRQFEMTFVTHPTYIYIQKKTDNFYKCEPNYFPNHSDVTTDAEAYRQK